MNLPNKLTVIRVLLIPVFLLFFLWQSLPLHYFWALVVFGAASFTDTLDGKIARKRGLITDFGKLMDPLADKLLVMSAIICLLTQGMIGEVLVIVILAREFLVTAIRQVAASKGQVLAADQWGKLKTVFQMVWICEALLTLQLQEPGALQRLAYPAAVVSYILLAVAAFFTIISGWNYCWKNRGLFADM